jgi:polysaccharide pyruvyl transferase WcaK-like protein
MDTPFMRSIQKLIQFIIKETDYHILLIPHVTWSRQDDRKICNELYKLMLSKDRINVLNVDNLSYLKIRYIISQCSLFVGGRTHSVISAYSTGVPTLALGYSIKAAGIAKDLGLNTRLVFETKNIKNEDDLLQQFKYLLEKQNDIKAQLDTVLPEYKKRAFTARDAISTYLH